jgi:hypothetical protein
MCQGNALMTSNKSTAKNKVAPVDQSVISRRLVSFLDQVSVEAEKEINIVETLISKNMISREEVVAILAANGKHYDPTIACDPQLLELIVIAAGANMRTLRLRHQEEYFPVQTTKFLDPSNVDSEVDSLSCFMEVRLNGDGGVHLFPVSKSNHQAIAASLFGRRNRYGLSEFYEDYLAFFTLDSRLVFINRARVEHVRFHDPLTAPVECKAIPEGLVEAFHDYFEILDMFSHIGFAAAAPLLESPLMKSVHRVVGDMRHNLAHIAEENADLRPSDTIDLLFSRLEIESYNVEHINLTGLDAALSSDSDEFVVDHALAQLTFRKNEVAMATVPVFRCKQYANSLEMTHYQSVQAACAISSLKER